MPGPGDICPHDISVLERPAPDGPFGAKGPGEMCANPVMPAIANAIFNAVGVRMDELPITPEKVLRAIKAQFVVPDGASAADLPQSAPTPIAYTPPVPDWIVTVGIEGRIIPAWPGAPTNQIAPSWMPLVAQSRAMPVSRLSSGRATVSASM